jgi:hypothetical protein
LEKGPIGVALRGFSVAVFSPSCEAGVAGVFSVSVRLLVRSMTYIRGLNMRLLFNF